MIPRRAIVCLGLSQLISWGISYYLIGVFGERIAADLGWSRETVYSGFSLALLAMGVSSPLVGRLVDRRGGKLAMIAGAVFNACGCLMLAAAQTHLVYFCAWILLGLGMRLSLYDAAFAALARIGGPGARRPMSQITLLGGLASTVFWPIGNQLADLFGWRGALMGYAFMALVTIPLHATLPNARYREPVAAASAHPVAPLAASGRPRLVAALLYAAIVTLTNFLNSGMSAHMIAILAGLGLGASAAVNAATLRGIGQSLARLCEVLFGRTLHPFTLNLAATAILPLAFLAGLLASAHWTAAAAFAFFYGAGNGLVTITRGTLPLVLFDHRSYGSFVGRLIAPSFLLSAAAPVIYAKIISSSGEQAALILSVAVALLTVLAAAALKLLFGEGK
ncbi:MFS transporter [Aquamicrobium sp. LC103]|uniref:MFS transporter n=1 Tax=Aquamicrobium sp. LC103 TaxID=1120658 RepID=UPI00063ECBDF|nr:MFS transporter [Aquamicrobium sp. LC103]TKT74888.1 MFS transporter [Aquamicrobium sp. LC103]